MRGVYLDRIGASGARAAGCAGHCAAKAHLPWICPIFRQHVAAPRPELVCVPFESDDPGRGRRQLLETSLAAFQRCSTVEKEGIEFPAEVVQAAAWTYGDQHGWAPTLL